MNHPNSHPTHCATRAFAFVPPVLRNGEARRLRDAGGIAHRNERTAGDGRPGTEHRGWLLAGFLNLRGTQAAASTARGDAKRGMVLALALIAATPALAAVGPNIRAVQPDQLDDYWVLANYSTLTADVPNSGTNLSKPTCSAVTYMIGSDGVTRDIVILGSTSAGAPAGLCRAGCAARIRCVKPWRGR